VRKFVFASNVVRFLILILTFIPSVDGRKRTFARVRRAWLHRMFTEPVSKPGQS
jgi:hypothetical protein